MNKIILSLCFVLISLLGIACVYSSDVDNCTSADIQQSDLENITVVDDISVCHNDSADDDQQSDLENISSDDNINISSGDNVDLGFIRVGIPNIAVTTEEPAPDYRLVEVKDMGGFSAGDKHYFQVRVVDRWGNPIANCKLLVGYAYTKLDTQDISDDDYHFKTYKTDCDGYFTLSKTVKKNSKLWYYIGIKGNSNKIGERTYGWIACYH